MSLNLCFSTIPGGHHVEFPFQTPTELTHKVLKLKTNEERVQAIEQYFHAMGYFKPNEYDTIEWATDTLQECKRMINDPTLILEYI